MPVSTMPSTPPVRPFPDFSHLPFTFESLKAAGFDIGLVVCAIVVAIVLHKAVTSLLSRIFHDGSGGFIQTIVRFCGPPVRWLVILFLVYFALYFARSVDTLSGGIDDFINRLLGVALIIAFTWFALALLHVGREWILRRYQITNPDNLHARRVHTQIKLLERVVTSLVVIIAFGCVLMTFDRVRQLGVSLLASAGIVGVILGFAAQKILAGLLAGLQVAITEPIRIDDVVIVEGEWGIIEEITLTYVVVRIWDLRRLVVPMTYFLEKPFQNWTRTSADLLGTVYLYLDPTVDVEPLRAELTRIVSASPLWDKKVVGVQVSDAKEHTVEVRCLVSASNSSATWDLRCLVREKLLEFIKRTQPSAIPRYRYQDDQPRESIARLEPPPPPPAIPAEGN